MAEGGEKASRKTSIAENETVRRNIAEEIARFKTKSEIAQDLTDSGWLEAEAKLSVERIFAEVGPHLQRKLLKNIITHMSILIIGVLITALSLVFSKPGGSFILAWGAILFGGFYFLRALSKWSKFDKIYKERLL